ncbi:MAG: hypothetical protein HYV24_09465 [Deltaproteobacteria bacterium]|nr:hypothetical protein [Deltaproteobacteria bacterium]
MRLLAIFIIATAFLAPLLRPLSARATPHICSIGEKECRHGEMCPHRKKNTGRHDHGAAHAMEAAHHGHDREEGPKGPGCGVFLECGNDESANYSDALEMPFLVPVSSIMAVLDSGRLAQPDASRYTAFYPASIDKPPSALL